MFYVLVVGRAGSRVAAARAGVEGDQPGPHHQPGVREAVRQRPGPRRVRLPRAARLLAGRGRPVRVRLAGAGLPPLHGARAGPPVVRGVRRADAARRCAVRQPVLRARDPFEVYSSLVAKLSVWGRRDGLLVVRSPLANLDTVPVAPGLLGVDGGAVRQHGVRLVQGLQRLGPVHPAEHVVGAAAQQPGPAGLLRGGRPDLRGRHA